MHVDSFQKLRSLARASKAQRFLHNPARYLAFLWKSKLLPQTGICKSSLVEATTFWGEPMQVLLPSSSDIFLTGGKTHDSEIRLAQWLANHIRDYDRFVDVGAHVGFFSLLAAHFSPGEVPIQSFEPSRAAFALLSQNTKAHQRITVTQAAIGKAEGTATFHEFGHGWAEYSSLVLENYPPALRQTLEKEKTDYEVPVQTLDSLLQPGGGGANRVLIKIDTEGNELAVLEGAQQLLQSERYDLAIEFLDNGNESYRRAEQMLRRNGFEGHLIKEDGTLEAHADILGRMGATGADSENVVFRKRGVESRLQ